MTRIAPRPRLLAVVAAASFTIAGCGVSTGSDEPVATLTLGSGSTVEISQDDLRAMMGSINGSQRFVDAIYNGELPVGAEQAVLTQMIQIEVLRSGLDGAGATVDDAAVTTAEDTLRSQLEQAFASSADPATEADEVAEEIGIYFDLIADTVATSTALDEAFSANVEGDTGVPCASHILVADEADADAILAELEGGADFATIAAERSLDTGSGAQGGDLGCTDPQGFVAEFRDAVLAAELDELVGPIETEFGFHIIKVTGYDNSTLVDAEFNALFTDVVVVVDPEVGNWDPTTQQVTPPAEP